MARRAKLEFVMGRNASMPKLADGSKRILCAKCKKHRVWATPAMLVLDVMVICATCAPRQRKVVQ